MATNALGEEYAFINWFTIPKKETTYNYGGGSYDVSRYFYIFAPAWSFYAHIPSEWWTEIIKPHYRTNIVVNQYNHTESTWSEIHNRTYYGNDENAYLNCNHTEYSDNTNTRFIGYNLYEIKITPTTNSGEDSITIKAKSMVTSVFNNPEGEYIYGGNGTDFVMYSSVQNRDEAIRHFRDSMRGTLMTKENSNFMYSIKL